MASGKPDYHNDSIISGKHLATFVPVGVDVNGNMLAIMQGDFGGVPQTIAVDAAGRMIANLGAQDISVLVTTNIQGDIRTDLCVYGFLGAGSYDVVDVTGNGTLIGGYVTHDTAISHKTCGASYVIDGVVQHLVSFEELNKCSVSSFPFSCYQCLYYDDINFKYVIGLNGGISFKTSFKVRLYERTGVGGFEGIMVFSLNP